MPNPMILLGGSTMPQRHSTPHEEKLVAGKVNRVGGDGVFAVVGTFSKTFEFGPLRVGAGLTPAVGEECLIVFDNNGRGYVLWLGS